MGTYETLAALDVGQHIEKKEGLSYLTWSWAWDEIKRLYPEASYTIWKDEKGLPYVYDPLTGFMVYTSVTIDGVTHEMWLPVMDGKNKAMKAEAYEYEGTTWVNGKKTITVKTVQAATMFDINKTIMRCLVKNLAMFGLGLYIYAGEDLPKNEEPEEKAPAPKPAPAVQEAEAKAKVLGYINRHQFTKEKIEKLCSSYGVASVNDLNLQQCNHYINLLRSKGVNIDE